MRWRGTERGSDKRSGICLLCCVEDDNDDDDVLMLSFSVTLVENNSLPYCVLHTIPSFLIVLSML
jgi:hypothetical protein